MDNNMYCNGEDNSAHTQPVDLRVFQKPDVVVSSQAQRIDLRFRPARPFDEAPLNLCIRDMNVSNDENNEQQVPSVFADTDNNNLSNSNFKPPKPSTSTSKPSTSHQHPLIQSRINFPSNLNLRPRALDQPSTSSASDARPVSVERDISEFYELGLNNRCLSRKYAVECSNYRLKFKNMVTLPIHTVSDRISDVLNEVFEQTIRSKEADYDRARVVIRAPSLDNSVNLKFDSVNSWTAQKVFDCLESLEQSHKGLFHDDELEMDIILLQQPRPGGAPCSRKQLDIESLLSKKHSIIQIKNSDDNLCLARALVVAMEHVKRVETKKAGEKYNELQFKKIIDHRCYIQRTEALKLCQVAGVDTRLPCGIEELDKFQACLKNDFEIIVHLPTTEKELFYPRQFMKPQPPKQLHLMYHNNHFDVVTTVGGFYDKRGYCPKCYSTIPKRISIKDHQCARTCLHCHGQHSVKPQIPQWVKCETCHRYFTHKDCFEAHKANQNCTQFHRCTRCGVIFSTKVPHVCKTMCKHCLRVHPVGCCFVMTGKEEHVKSKAKPVVKPKYLFFDLETRTDIATGQLKPVLCVVSYQLVVGGQYQYTYFSGENCIGDFIQFLFREETIRKPSSNNQKWIKMQRMVFENSTVIAHNLKGFDGIFIIKYLLSRQYKPDVIYNGAKIMTINLTKSKIRFIDSLCFIALPLRDFPKTFGIEEVKKGYFPFHFYNSNQHYKGPLPDRVFYNPERMKSHEIPKFDAWYESEKVRVGDSWDMEKELLEYCTSDVKLLTEGCRIFSQLMHDLTGLYPFESDITLSSFANRVFRVNFLEPYSLGIIPSEGYSARDVQSVTALKWLAWVEHTKKTPLQTALNGEKRVHHYKLDGFDPINKIVYEFYGCYYHSCPKCTRAFEKSRNPMLTHQENYQRTLDRLDFLKKELPGHSFVTLFECEFRKELKANPEMAAFCKEFMPQKFPITPRGAFYGGRTESFCGLAEAGEGEKISYLDFTSLYPYVNKYFPYPKGHPLVIHRDFDYNLDSYFGLISATVVPPCDLYLPVLPYRHEGRLYFPLCRRCVEQQPQVSCSHNKEEDRALTAVWCSPELYLAMRMGYQLKKIHAVWHYTEKYEYDQKAGKHNLFSQYVNTFLGGKLAASGWPNHASTATEKQAFLDKVFEREGVKIDPSTVKKNSGIRALCKFLLNSLWGFLGMDMRRSKSEYLNTYSDYFQLMCNTSREITDLRLIDEETIMVTHMPTFEPIHMRGNSVISSFVTAYGRITLYDAMKILGPTLKYVDTDSLIFIHPKHSCPLATGSNLGELTDEIGDKYGPNVFIEKLVVGGAKNYCLFLSNGVVEMKAKGITLNHAAKEILTPELVQKMVLGEGPDSVSIPIPFNLVRDKGNATLTNKPSSKIYRLTNTKRFFRNRQELQYSYPHGFKFSQL